MCVSIFGEDCIEYLWRLFWMMDIIPIILMRKPRARGVMRFDQSYTGWMVKVELGVKAFQFVQFTAIQYDSSGRVERTFSGKSDSSLGLSRSGVQWKLTWSLYVFIQHPSVEHCSRCWNTSENKRDSPWLSKITALRVCILEAGRQTIINGIILRLTPIYSNKYNK